MFIIDFLNIVSLRYKFSFFSQWPSLHRFLLRCLICSIRELLLYRIFLPPSFERRWAIYIVIISLNELTFRFWITFTLCFVLHYRVSTPNVFDTFAAAAVDGQALELAGVCSFSVFPCVFSFVAKLSRVRRVWFNSNSTVEFCFVYFF